MIVSPQEYNSLIHRLMDPNEYSKFLRIPENEPIYEIDLNQRKIKAPEFLSVEKDHNSEIIWFMTDRFYDNIDLYDSTCWIQYVNANKEKYYYAAPILVYNEEFGNEKILIPWAIGNNVTDSAGNVQFSFQFFSLNETATRFLYILNTQIATSKILTGSKVDPMDAVSAHPEAEAILDDLHKLTEAYDKLSKAYELYWIEVQ